MDILIGLGLLTYGVCLIAYSYVSADFIFNTRSYFQLAVSLLGSAYLLSSCIKLGYIKTLISNALSKAGKEELTVDDKTVVPNIEINDGGYNVNDFNSISYLRQRALKLESNEALELIIKLNDILFRCGTVKMVEKDKGV